MAEQKNPVEIVVKGQCDGFALDVRATLSVDHIAGLMMKLKSAGVAPANSPYVWSQQPGGQAERPVSPVTGGAPEAQPPTCPVHHVVMKPSKHGQGWYCSAVVGTSADGQRIYCREKAS